MAPLLRLSNYKQFLTSNKYTKNHNYHMNSNNIFIAYIYMLSLYKSLHV